MTRVVQCLAQQLIDRTEEVLPTNRPHLGIVDDTESLRILRDSALAVLSHPDALSTNMRLLEDGHETPRGVWLQSRIGEAEVIYSELRNHELDRAVMDGSLFVVDSIDTRNSELMLFREALEYGLGRVWINTYMVSGADASFGTHSDTHDALILQLSGHKRWRVAAGVGCSLDDSTPLIDVVLSPNQFLFVPGGTEHHVSAVGQFSLHLTIVFDSTAALIFQQHLTDFVYGRPPTNITKADVTAAMTRVSERRLGTSLPFVETGLVNDLGGVRLASRLKPALRIDEEGRGILVALAKVWTIEPELIELILELCTGRELNWSEVCAMTDVGQSGLRQWLRMRAEDGLIITRP